MLLPKRENAFLAKLLEFAQNTELPMSFSNTLRGPTGETPQQTQQRHPEGVFTSPPKPSRRMGDQPYLGELLKMILSQPDDPATAAFDFMNPLMTMQGKVAGKADDVVRKVYQGSPHKIAPEPGYPLGRLKDEFLGSGEGAAMYGHGHYAGEAPDVGRSYRDHLTTDPDMRIGGTPIYDVYKQIEDKANRLDPIGPNGAQPEYDKMALLEDLMNEGDLTSVRERATNFDSYHPETMAWFEKEVAPNFTRKGQVYEMALKAADEDFLLWDRPFSEQSPKVQEVLSKLGRNSNASGADIYARLSRRMQDSPMPEGDISWVKKGNDQLASEYLKSKGIRGIKYLDQGSRNEAWVLKNLTGEPFAKQKLENLGLPANTPVYMTSRAGETGKLYFSPEEAQQAISELNKDITHNFVVFDPEDLEILKVLGLVGAVVGGGAAVANTEPVN